MTRDEIYAKLGLQPATEFQLATIHANTHPALVTELGAENALDHLLDGTGRTTSLIVDALVVAASGRRVKIEAGDAAKAKQLELDARAMAAKIDLPIPGLLAWDDLSREGKLVFTDASAVPRTAGRPRFRVL